MCPITRRRIGRRATSGGVDVPLTTVLGLARAATRDQRATIWRYESILERVCLLGSWGWFRPLSAVAAPTELAFLVKALFLNWAYRRRVSFAPRSKTFLSETSFISRGILRYNCTSIDRVSGDTLKTSFLNIRAHGGRGLTPRVSPAAPTRSALIRATTLQVKAR